MRNAQIPLTGFLLLSTLLIVNCAGDAGGEDRAANVVNEKVTDVKVLTVRPQRFVDYIELTGTVHADIDATISAEESGVIAEFVKDKGDWVNTGDVIVKLKSKVLQASVDEARASYLLSEATFERQSNLYKDNVISEQRYLEYKYNLQRDRARYENLLARLEKTTIVSPIAGRIDAKFVDVGEFLQPGTPLVRIVKTDLVKIRAGVPERYLPDVRLGSVAHMTFDVLPDLDFTGKVTFLGPSIDKNSRTFPIEIALQNRKNLLKPEMFADIKIKRVQLEDVVVIPRDALIETHSGKFVFVEQGDLASKREVRIGGSYNNQAWISEGVAPGDRLIIVGHRDLVDGERIAVHD